jgi:hypothetical protein
MVISILVFSFLEEAFLLFQYLIPNIKIKSYNQQP